MKKIINWIKKIIHINDPLYIYKKVEDTKGIYISGTELIKLLRLKLKDKTKARFRYIVADKEYYLPSKRQVQEVIRINRIDSLIYRPEAFDCDDFAYLLKSLFIKLTYKNKNRRAPLAIALVYGLLPTPHAFNILIDDNKDVYIIEPQTDKFTLLENSSIKSIYFMML